MRGKGRGYIQPPCQYICQVVASVANRSRTLDDRPSSLNQSHVKVTGASSDRDTHYELHELCQRQHEQLQVGNVTP